MVYSLIDVERVLEAQPEITVLDLAAEAARDHSREKGCKFERGAARC